MALQDRVFSLETEYAITFYSDQDRKPGSGKIVDALMQAVADSHGTRAGSFLVNGSRLAHDVGHAEWSLPECRSGRELAIYDKAADHLFIKTVIPDATRLMRREGFHGRVVVAKNNADPFGNSYGCHENYQMQYNADLLAEDDFIRYIAQAMIPFLTTRLIFAGSGRLVMGSSSFRRWGSNLNYEFSQRAGFIQTVVSRDTTRERPIFNLAREGESFAVGNYRRLHQIMGDATLSGWATWVKMGSTGLLLRMIEDIFVDDVPVLNDPVAAMRIFNSDLSGRQTAPLQDGRMVTALDIQWHYYDLADGYLNVFGATGEDEDLMEAWGKALEDFERDPMLLRDRADWAIKKHLLDKFLNERGAAFDSSTVDRQLMTDLQAFDLRFHELSSEGSYTQLYPVDTLLTQDEIQFGQDNPPPYTRARIRGEVVRLVRDYGLSGHADGWMGASIREADLRLNDPMVFDHRLLAAWDRPWIAFERDLEENPANDELHYKLGKAYQNLGHHQRALRAFRAAANLAPERLLYSHELARTLLLVGLYEESAAWWEKYNAVRGLGRGLLERDHNSLGDAYRLLGDDHKAGQAYHHALRDRGPLADLANRNLALLHLKNGETTSAETYFNKRQSSERLITWTGLGAIQIANGYMDQGKAMLQQVFGLASQQMTFGMTPESARYVLAAAKIGLEADDGLEALHAALHNQTALAADGLYATKLLLRLLAAAPQPPRDAGESYQLIEAVQVQTNQPDPPDLPPMAEPVRLWLHAALDHPIKRIRQQALEYLGWRLEDMERAPGLTEFAQRLIALAHNDPDADIRRQAVQMLAHPAVGGPVIDKLITCLHDPNPGVRWAVQTSLEKLSQPDPTPPGTVIFATRPEPREAAPPALGRFFRRPEPPPAAGFFDGFDDDTNDSAF